MNAIAGRVPIKRVLMSVSDKTGLIGLARTFMKFNVEIVSTGGTAALLSAEGISFTPIEKVTGNPEAFGGRMKTISFEVGSALLFRRGHPGDEREAQALGIESIDMVVCNLYPFEATVRGTDDLGDWIENIDIGGPTMIRAAAKNF
ncbi:MAG: bifunctional phosphoribosylaminoimidazolecarboxamide formyltransferase/IMP cyclohydrolase PurH, partial [Proteobacteria bacterium]|nr:bifunctional phosphoribosylaminoimidazolecarboxamide formyltransferase/IMP cyclohydrolase PurH [Pseudomonadota bacterium]